MSSAGAGSRGLVEAYEQSLSDEARRVDGVHYTPHALARVLVELAVDVLGWVPRTVHDPTCGAGSFLLAAADALFDRGVDPVEIVDRRLSGSELDPAAAAVARSALERWAEDHGAPTGSTRACIQVADTLLQTADAVAEHPAGVDLVVGNPPFLSQLATRTARSEVARRSVVERYGAIGAYADSASLFLRGSLDLVRPGGVVVMLQPQSFLAARDTAGVRAELIARADLVSLWSTDAQLFDASVHVCAPVLRRRDQSSTAHAAAPAPNAASTVEVYWVRGDLARTRLPPTTERAPRGEESWGPLFAPALGLPRVRPHGGARLGSVATATAGFRDEFYALCEASVDLGEQSGVRTGRAGERASVVAEWEGGSSGADDVDGVVGPPRLITVGMIDPGRTSWGERARRFGGRSQLAPVLDTAALAAASPRVAAWAAKRLVPKVLVATQTRVVEVVADPLGAWVPVTPTISVEPIGVEPIGVDPSGPHPVESVWRVAAALLAPTVSAQALAEHLGAGLSPGALRWSARSVLQVELPIDEEQWHQGAGLARLLAVCASGDRSTVLAQLGAVMCRAHGVDPGDEVFDWWLERVLRAAA